MKILLTGDAGFIGSALRIKLEKAGHSVFGMDIKRGGAEDIRKIENVRNVMEIVKPEMIIHLAALAGVRESLRVPDQYFETNILGTYWILLMAEHFGVKKVLVASSSSVYGGAESPLVETMECNKQLSPYAMSKKGTEMVCAMQSRNLPVIVFRPFTVYGENGREDMVIGQMLKAVKNNTEFTKFGDGSSSRGYTHLDDLGNGIIKLLDYTPRNNYEVFNLGGSEVITLNELIDLFKSKYQSLKIKEVPKPDVDPMQNLADISKAKELIGWSPVKKFREEIIKII